MRGTTPEGARNEQEAARWVRDMFGRIAPRYDRANHLLSYNLDRLWRRHTVKRVRDVLDRPDARVLDICCGTGDLAIALRKGGRARVLASDFCHPMLQAASKKIPGGVLFESDALRLPVRDASLDLVTVAFGFRNLTDYDAGLREMRRVLRPGGVAAILEFSQPRNSLFAAVYGFYSRRILPWIGGLITGAPDAYRYLPESIRKFPDAPELAEAMRRAGFSAVSFEYLTGGSVALHLGTA
jgi:demethylmenaquinone methyltransferase/2-methoxy-6-polyprenyl-1,4-benzoquinol methylase